MGSDSQSQDIVEGSNVYFECDIKVHIYTIFYFDIRKKSGLKKKIPRFLLRVTLNVISTELDLDHIYALY